MLVPPGGGAAGATTYCQGINNFRQMACYVIDAASTPGVANTDRSSPAALGPTPAVHSDRPGPATLAGASLRQAHHLLENMSLKISYSPVYALLCMENAPITV